MALTTIPVELVTLDNGVTITVDDNSDNLTLVSTDADSSFGPNLNFYRNSSSPADDDLLAQIDFNGRNDNSQDVLYANIQTQIIDASDGTEDGRFQINTIVAGTDRNRFLLTPTETVLNDNSIDLDFRIESNGNANMLFVDGGNDVVNIGAATVETGDQFSIHGSGTNTTMRIYNTNAGTDGGLLIFQKNSSSPADADVLGDIRFHGNDDGGGMTQFARIKIESTDVSNGTEDGKMRFEILKAGTTREFLQLGPSNIVFNDDQQDIDFRIESADTTHFVFLDAGNNSFNIDDQGTAGVRTTINKNSSGARVVSTGSYNNVLKIKNGNTANTIDRDATVQFQVGGADEGYLSWIHSDGTNSTNHGRFEFAGRSGGTRNRIMTLDADGWVTMPKQPAFQVKKDAYQSNIGTSLETVTWETEVADQGSNFSSNTFTAPVDGLYQFNVTLRLQDLDIDHTYFQALITVTNDNFEIGIIDPNFSADLSYFHMNGSFLIELDANDTAYVRVRHSGGASQTDISYSGDSTFSGYLVA